VLVLNVIYSDKITAQVAKDLLRSRAWACWCWLKRYYDEGTEGLKDRSKGGRYPTKITKQAEYKIKVILKAVIKVGGPQNRLKI
jgi:hypothetical protein